MTGENDEQVITITVPPNVWTAAITIGEAPTESNTGAFYDQREVIEIFHTNGMNLEFTAHSDGAVFLMTDPAEIDNYDGWRVRKTPYVDWDNRRRAEEARTQVDQLDPLAGHPLTALGATRPDVTQQNIDRGYLELEDTDQGQRVRLTEAGKQRAKELLGLPDDFPLDEVP